VGISKGKKKREYQTKSSFGNRVKSEGWREEEGE